MNRLEVDPEHQIIRSKFIAAWVNIDLMQLMHSENLTASSIRASYDQFMAAHPEADFEIIQCFIGALKSDSDRLAYELIEPMKVLLQEEDLTHPEHAFIHEALRAGIGVLERMLSSRIRRHQ